MDNDLEQLRINRVKMRADTFAFLYSNIKRVLKEMATDNKLYNRQVINVPDNWSHLKPIRLGSENIRVGLETHYESDILIMTKMVIWIHISNKYIK